MQYAGVGSPLKYVSWINPFNTMCADMNFCAK